MTSVLRMYFRPAVSTPPSWTCLPHPHHPQPRPTAVLATVSGARVWILSARLLNIDPTEPRPARSSLPWGQQ